MDSSSQQRILEAPVDSPDWSKLSIISDCEVSPELVLGCQSVFESRVEHGF